MLFVLYNSPEFQRVDLEKRKKAAWEARQRAMHNWRFWLAIAFLAGATLVCSLLQKWLFGSKDTAMGAGIGFLVGIVWYGRTLYIIGMPHYRQILMNEEKSE